MSPETEEQEILRLREELSHHNYRYYVLGEPDVSDQEFDRLFDRLVELEGKHPELADPNSPSRRVGGTTLDGFESVDHKVPMLSMEKSYSASDIEDWLTSSGKRLTGESFRFYVDPKVDGVAVGLRYEKGDLVLAVTRGDGVSGDVITQNVRTIGTIPLKLFNDPPEVLEVRGEIYMTRGVFDGINEAITKEGGDPYKNPRNLTAGTLKSLDSTTVAKRKLSFLMHGYGEIKGASYGNFSDLISAAGKHGIPTSSHAVVCDEVSQVLEFINGFEETRRGMDYDTDGVVIKIDDLDQQARLGTRSRSPRWAIAFKYDTERAETKLVEVSFQVGKTGAITPRATMIPVELAGTTVTHASLHNFQEIARKDIRLGDAVIIEKAGEIIPYVVRSIAEKRSGEEKEILPPTECPCCGGPVAAKEGEVVLRCTTLSCPERLRSSLRHFAGRRALDIDGLGEKLIDQLVEADIVKGFADLFRLTKEKLLPLERMGQKKADKLLAALEVSKSGGLARLLNALCIPHVGESVAKMLAGRFLNVETLRSTDEQTFSDAEKIGPIMARELVAWFKDEQNLAMIADLAELGVVMEHTAPAKVEAVIQEGEGEINDAALTGLSVVVTGTLVRRSRNEIHALIEAAGGTPSKSVTKKTNLLVAGEKAGSKLKKAQKLGIEVISEDDLYQRLGLS